MSGDTLERLIDRIYEAAVVPEHWLRVLDEMARLTDGDGTLIFTRSGLQERCIGSGEVYDLFNVGLKQGWQAKNPRAARLFASRHAGFLNDLDIFTREELDREPYFTQFLRPLGFGWGAATAIKVPTGDQIAFDVERKFIRGPVQRHYLRMLDTLRPHLARASMISARLSFERVHTAAETLALIGLPAVVLHSTGRALAANKLFESQMPHVATEGRERIALMVPSADTLFEEALQRIQQGILVGVRSIPIPAREGRPAAIVHLVPIRGAAHDVFLGAVAVMVITAVELRKVPDTQLIQGLFDLTPAEARIAHAIAEGATVDSVAIRHGLSKETVRSQLKATLAKTGVNRQSQLAALLSGMAP